MPFLAPVFTAIGTFAASSAVAGFIVNTAASLLLSAAANALMPKPKGPTLQPRTVTIREPVVPRDIVYGRVQKGGVIVFLHSTRSKDTAISPEQDFLHLVIVLATHQVQSIGAVYFDGEMVISASGAVESGSRYSGNIGIQKRLGTVGQAPFDALREAAPDLWTASHRLDNCAAVYLRLKYTQDAFPSGIPNIKVDIEGKNDILDPRTGLRGYTTNAALCLADYMSLSPFGPGLTYGGQDGINTASLIEAANICDETVTISGGTERRYTCNGVVNTSESPQTIIEAMLTASAGHVVWQGGDWHVRAGAYRIPTASLSADDIRDEGFTVQTRKSRAANFNGVRGKFISPENDWQPDDFPAYKSNVYLAEDSGERKWKDISLPFTISASAAQRLAKIEMEKARRQISVQAPCKLSAWRTAVGDTVALDYARWGFVEKPFFVKKLTLSLRGSGDAPLLLPEVELQETSPLVYDWSASEAQIYAAAPRTSLPSAFDIPVPGVPALSESLYVTRDGSSVRALIRASWSAAPSDFVTGYRLRARRTRDRNGQDTGAEWVYLGQTEQTFWEIRDVEPGTWEVQVRSVSGLGVRSDFVGSEMVVDGLFAQPAQLQRVSIQSAGGLAILKWQMPNDLDVQIGGSVVIRHSESTPATWPGSTFVDEVTGNQTIAVLPLMPGAYILRAKDASGVYGPETIVFTGAAQALAFAPVDSLQEDDDFTGDKSGVAIFGTGLQLASDVLFSTLDPVSAAPSIAYPSGEVAGEGVYTFATGMDLGSVRNVRLRRSIKIASINLRDTIGGRDGNVSRYESFGGSAGAEGDAWVEIQTTDDDPAGTPEWSVWSRVDSSEIRARGVRARAIFQTNDPSFTPRVSELRLAAEEVA